MEPQDKIAAMLQQEHFNVMAADKLDPQAAGRFERRAHGALNAYPDNPHILYSLGTFYAQTDRSGAGINFLKRAIGNGLDGPDAYNNLAAAYKCEHRDESAAQCYQKAINLCLKAQRINRKRAKQGKPPTQPAEMIERSLCDAYHGMASLYVNAGQPEKIIEWADKSLALNPSDNYARWNRALGCLEAGRWEEGFRDYDEAGFTKNPAGKIERKEKNYGGLPKWDGTPGKTVICYGEQGVGDELMFASMLPDLMKDCRVIIDCDKRLENLFKRSFPEAVAVYPTSSKDDPYDWIANHPDVDAWVPMGSLGRYYRPTAESFPRTPYIKADPGDAGRWRNILGTTDKMRIGISWAGGLKKTRFDQRSMALMSWADILKVPGIEWHSFQYHPQAADETAQVGQALGVPIHHWGDVIASYDITSAVLQSMDLVITVNTSLLHLCGSLGIETWCLTPTMCAWRYGTSGPNPFYGSVETLRQEKAGDWKPVLDTVRDTLIRLTTQREAA